MELLVKIVRCVTVSEFDSDYNKSNVSYEQRFLRAISQFFETVTLATTAEKMKFPIKDFFSKCDQIRRKLRIWLDLLKESLTENFIFSGAYPAAILPVQSPIVTLKTLEEYEKRSKLTVRTAERRQCH